MLGPDEVRKINEVFVFVLIVCGIAVFGFLMVFVGVLVGMITGWCVRNRRVPRRLSSQQENK
jgi:predicted PurR-regulated permease PerM